MKKEIRKILGSIMFTASFTLIFCFSAKAEHTLPQLYYKLSTSIVTPHISWANPYYKGPLHILVIAPRWRQRDTVELMERLDAKVTPVFCFNDSSLYLNGWDWGFEKAKGIQKQAVEKSLDDALIRNYDVIILAYAPIQTFPKSAVESILRKVEAGTGLVYIYPGNTIPNNPFVKELTLTSLSGVEQSAVSGIPVECLQLRNYTGPPKSEKELKNFLSFYRYGNGKVAMVNLNSTGFLAYPAGNDLDFETYTAYMINVILGVSKKQSQIQYTTYQPFLSSDAGKPFNYKLSLDNTGNSLRANITISVHPFKQLFVPKEPEVNQGINNASGYIASYWKEKKNISLPAGQSNVSFAIPGLAAGNYYIFVQVLSGGKKVSFCIQKLTVKSGIKIEKVQITPSAMDLNNSNRNIKVELDLSAPAPSNSSLSAVLLDNYDRILDAKTFEIKQNSNNEQFNLSVNHIFSTLGKVRVILSINKKIMSVKTGYFTVYHRKWPNFTFFAWGGETGSYDYDMMRKIEVSMGVDAFRGGDSIETLRIADDRCIPDMYRLLAGVKNGKVEPSYVNPDNRIERAKQIFSAVKDTMPFDPYAYLQGDEFGFINGGLPGASKGKNSIEDFRRYLKAKYKTIDNLNKQWGFNYDSFYQIEPVTTGSKVDAARKALDFSYLIDQWTYNWYVFGDSVRFYHDALKDIDPTAKLGLSTPLWNYYYRAYDWPVLMKYIEFFTPYNDFGGDAHYDIARCFAKPGTVLSQHYGSYSNVLNNLPYYKVMPYALLLDGCQNLFWYNLGFGDESGISPSMTPYPGFETTSLEVKKIKSGIGNLFVHSSRIKGRIGIEYNEPSFLFSFLVSSPNVPWTYNELRTCLSNLGYDYQFISDSQILKGGLSSYKILFLPVSQCISSRLSKKLKEFVEGGGLLIAVVKPGLFDGHGKYYGKSSPSSRIFGLEWKNPLQQLGLGWKKPLQQSSPGKIHQITGKYKNEKFQWTFKSDEQISVDTSVILDGATPISMFKGAPLVTYNNVGKGVAICLNFISYGQNINANIISAILSAQGIYPPVDIAPDPAKGSPGKWIKNFRFTRFSDGSALYCGFSRLEGKKPVSITIKFKNKGYVYDVLTGKYLGEHKTLRTIVNPYDAGIYAILQYKITGLSGSLETQSLPRGEEVKGDVQINVSGKIPGYQVIHLDVIRPDGKEPVYLRQNLVSINGVPAKFSVPMALNELTGIWKLKFTEPVSQKSTTLSFTLTKK
ncbi:MAG: beta-galactosidase trimerization domain-containing protein [Candidatus Omnitrophica bacterium]|nr:beta-galactosidase trimerization domain-containing protein [Candidatus Omnitrophota bacterium]